MEKKARAAVYDPSDDRSRQASRCGGRFGCAGFEQRHCGAVVVELRVEWIVTPFEREHVVVPAQDDGFPIAFAGGFRSKHQMADFDLVPTAWQVWRRLGVGELTESLVEVGPYRRHEAVATCIDAARFQ